MQVSCCSAANSRNRPIRLSRAVSLDRDGLLDAGTMAAMRREEFDRSIANEHVRSMFAGIGSVVAAGSFVEIAAALVYAILLGGRYGLAVALGQTFESNRQVCLQLAGLRDDPELLQQIKDVFARAKELYDQRSEVAHGAWMFADAPIGQVFRWRKWARLEPREWMLEELMDLAWKLTVVGEELDSISAAIDPDAVHQYRVAGLPINPPPA
jgi:hypothetical protein